MARRFSSLIQFMPWPRLSGTVDPLRPSEHHKHEEHCRELVEVNKTFGCHLPVRPNEPAPRSVSLSVSTTSIWHRATGAMTSWAMRSPTHNEWYPFNDCKQTS